MQVYSALRLRNFMWTFNNLNKPMKIALHNAHVSASMNFHFMNKWESKSSLLGTVFACTDCKVLLEIFGKPDFDPSIVCFFFQRKHLI